MTILEVTPLEGIDTEAAIPCDLLVSLAPFRFCRLPAVCRIIRTCGCGDRRTHFICAVCKVQMNIHGIWHVSGTRLCPEAGTVTYI